jgi:hypothetical protein
MNREQKMAFFFVVVFSIAIATSLIAIAILLYLGFGLQKASAGIGFLGIGGFAGLGPILFKKDKGTVAHDERVDMINRKAAVAAFGTSYLFAGLACMLPFFILGYKATISVSWLPMIFLGSGMTMMLVHSIVILVLYGRGGEYE